MHLLVATNELTALIEFHGFEFCDDLCVVAVSPFFDSGADA
jgi:hypothetical protein